jgi:hypothetical protein
MGINVRTTDVPTELAARVTAGREKRERDLRDLVRSGVLTLDKYLTDFKGFRAEHLEAVRARFQASIFGENRKNSG